MKELLIFLCFTLVPCSCHPTLPPGPDGIVAKRLVLSVPEDCDIKIPPNLPLPGKYEQKFGGTVNFSKERIEKSYVGAYKMGWGLALMNLSLDWSFDDAAGKAAVQGWEFDTKGCMVGYSDCLKAVKELQAKVGEEAAKKAVNEAWTGGHKAEQEQR